MYRDDYMPKYTIQINTKVGWLSINFDTLEELGRALKDLDLEGVDEEISKNIGKLLRIQVRQPKPGFEGVYRFTKSDLVELVWVPDNMAEAVALVMFAYHPEPASTEQIALSSGINNVASLYLTHTNYKKFWSKTKNGKYILSYEGFEWVLKKIIPKIKAISKEESAPPDKESAVS